MGTFFKDIVKWTDSWKCQCLMIQRLALWMDRHFCVQKSLQISAALVSYATLILAIMSLSGTQDILYFYPIYNHFLINPKIQPINSYQNLKQQCHYFENLSHVKFVGFNRVQFLHIRIVVMLIIWVTDMLGLYFSAVHPPCGTKMYVFGYIVTLLFFVLFPSQFCINFGDTCIKNSPIFMIYRIQFMIKFNLAWIGIASILLIIILYSITYYIREYCNICKGDDIFYNTIYGIGCIPFFVIAIINFVTAQFTSAWLINCLTLASMIINYLLYHAGTTIHKQLMQKQKQIRKILNQPQFILQQSNQIQFYQIQPSPDTSKLHSLRQVNSLRPRSPMRQNSLKNTNSMTKQYSFLKQNTSLKYIGSVRNISQLKQIKPSNKQINSSNKQIRINSKKSIQNNSQVTNNKMSFYKQWQNKLYYQFHEK